MAEMNVTAILEKLGGLRTELIELAFTRNAGDASTRRMWQ